MLMKPAVAQELRWEEEKTTCSNSNNKPGGLGQTWLGCRACPEEVNVRASCETAQNAHTSVTRGSFCMTVEIADRQGTTGSLLSWRSSVRNTAFVWLWPGKSTEFLELQCPWRTAKASLHLEQWPQILQNVFGHENEIPISGFLSSALNSDLTLSWSSGTRHLFTCPEQTRQSGLHLSNHLLKRHGRTDKSCTCTMHAGPESVLAVTSASRAIPGREAALALRPPTTVHSVLHKNCTIYQKANGDLSAYKGSPELCSLQAKLPVLLPRRER